MQTKARKSTCIYLTITNKCTIMTTDPNIIGEGIEGETEFEWEAHTENFD